MVAVNLLLKQTALPLHTTVKALGAVGFASLSGLLGAKLAERNKTAHFFNDRLVRA